MPTQEKGRGRNDRGPSADETTAPPEIYNKSNAAVYGLQAPAEAVSSPAVTR